MAQASTSDDDRRYAALLTSRFDMFCRAAFAVVEGDPLVPEPYIEALCFQLQEVQEGRLSRLLINSPPRHGKSFAISVAFPAFALGHDPRLEIVVVSYSQELSREHTDKFHRLVRSPFYKALFPRCVFSVSGLRVDRAVNTDGGGRRPVSVQGSLTGLGADIMVLDDLIKAHDVEYAVHREATVRFYRETGLTRLNDQRTGRIIAAQQRLHQDDISSELLEGGLYKHINLPSIAAKRQVFPLYCGREWVMEQDDLLSPTRFPQEVLDRLRQEMGTAAYSAQYLQNPLPPSSMLLDVKRLHWVDEPFARDELQYVVQSVDTAITLNDWSDYSVIMTFGWDGEQWCLLNIVRGRFDMPALKGVVLQQAEDWRANKIVIEGSHIGEALVSMMRGHQAMPIAPTPEGSKEERLAAATEALYDGVICFPKHEPWSEMFSTELRNFPGDKHDDMVDALTQFVRWQRVNSVGSLIHSRRRRSGRRIQYR